MKIDLQIHFPKKITEKRKAAICTSQALLDTLLVNEFKNFYVVRQTIDEANDLITKFKRKVKPKVGFTFKCNLENNTDFSANTLHVDIYIKK